MDIDKDVKKMPKVKKKGEKRTIITIFKIVAVILLLAIQIGIMFLLYSTTKTLYNYARFIFDVVKIISVLYLLYRHDTAAYKVSWILFIMFFPVAGLVAYILWGNNKLNKNTKQRLDNVKAETQKLLNESALVSNSLDFHKKNIVNYATNVTGYPLYINEGVEFFEIGEKFFESLKKDLLKAEKYILIEFYIFSKGKLWDEIFEILKKKAKEGVRVEIVYDSLGCLFKLPKNYKEEWEKYGFYHYRFNPFTLFINGYINYRDHRKIVVIDGKTAYTGGVNLADEYVNVIEKYGHWKDGGIKIKGDATWSFVIMFLRIKAQVTKEKIDYLWYKKDKEENELSNTRGIIEINKKEKIKGYILPFEDGPDNRKRPTENIYIQTINNAIDYIYLNTPYFIPSETLLNAILNAARSGIDVRIVTPHIPDKKLIQIATRANYEILLESGVRVFEYKPGFIHAKNMVVDDKTAIVGSANLDFRSMHLNFEVSTWMYETGEEIAIKEDFINMSEKCIEVKLDQWKKRPLGIKWLEAIISAFSPML